MFGKLHKTCNLWPNIHCSVLFLVSLNLYNRGGDKVTKTYRDTMDTLFRNTPG